MGSGLFRILTVCFSRLAVFTVKSWVGEDWLRVL